MLNGQDLELDILVDLNGHTRGGRARLLALDLAPVVLHYQGFPDSMGMPSVRCPLSRLALSRLILSQPLTMPAHRSGERRARLLAPHSPCSGSCVHSPFTEPLT